jgi:hypothetical protein
LPGPGAPEQKWRSESPHQDLKKEVIMAEGFSRRGWLGGVFGALSGGLAGRAKAAGTAAAATGTGVRRLAALPVGSVTTCVYERAGRLRYIQSAEGCRVPASSHPALHAVGGPGAGGITTYSYDSGR